MLNDNIFIQFLFVFKRRKIILYNIKVEDHIKLNILSLLSIPFLFFKDKQNVFPVINNKFYKSRIKQF